MAVDRRLETILRTTLGDSFKTYVLSPQIHQRPTSHADIYHMILVKPNPNSCRANSAHFALKVFKHANDSSDAAYEERHDPGRLWSRESRVLSWINRKVRFSTSVGVRKPYLVPQFHGASLDHFALTTSFISGEVLANLLSRVPETSETPNQRDIFEGHFIRGIKDVAKFDGLINAEENRMDAPDIFNKEATQHQVRENRALKCNLIRLYYAFHSDAFHLDHFGLEFDTQEVLNQLRAEQISLDSRISELQQLSKRLHVPVRYQHNDCNGQNMIVTGKAPYSNRFVDLENFGPASSVSDISSYCIVLTSGGNNHIFRSENFPHYRHVYHSYEHAWRNMDLDLVKRLDSYVNGQFGEVVGQIMTEREYADLTAGFFADAISKTVKLAAAGVRFGSSNTPVTSRNTFDVSTSRTDVEELFRAVNSMSGLINTCTDPTGVRDYFYTLGKTLNDIGYNVPSGVLVEIRSGISIGNNVMGQIPTFKRAD
ncbi:hypothetical protein COY27_05850 [Candidatus Woesearchaeota archaeon CG_4_10_14_0_2_um_filter_33_13]|nr:MAG: hypothetical protein COY27_05850 [Candidatus Woesearchaeota archaeon CG_4_10_14_0_2_um_filter_33_13]